MSCDIVHLCCSIRSKYWGSFQPNCGANETIIADIQTKNIINETRPVVLEWM